VDSTLSSYQAEICWYTFVMELYGLRPYVITICNITVSIRDIEFDWYIKAPLREVNILCIIKIGLTLLCMCLVFLTEWNLVMVCFDGRVGGRPVHRVGWCASLAVLWLVYCAGGIFVYTEIPNGSFSYFYCMVVRVLMYLLPLEFECFLKCIYCVHELEY